MTSSSAIAPQTHTPRQNIEKEIDDYICYEISQKRVVKALWAINAIMARHPSVEGPDRDFYIRCGWEFLSDCVRSAMKRYGLRERQAGAEGQEALPGFEHLQPGYPIERDGERVVVPIEQLTDEELERKAQFYESMAASCRDHARELRAYRDQRAAAA